MDKIVLPAFLVQNLPTVINRNQAITEIIQLLRKVKGDLNEDDIRIYFYDDKSEKGNPMRSAIVRHANVTWGLVKLAMNSSQKIQKHPFKITPDFGMPRNAVTGRLSTPLSGYALMFFQDMYMCPRRGLQELWNPSLYPKMDANNQSNKLVINGAGKNTDLELLFAAGRTVYWSFQKKAEYIILDFATFLDKLQAISAINRNPAFSTSAIIDGVSIHRQGGLGHDDANIDFAAFENRYGYVPFNEFDPQVLRNYPFENCYRECYKCDFVGLLEPRGITTCGLYITAECTRCEYVRDAENPLAARIAISCFGENFTRVRLGVNSLSLYTNQEMALNIVHTPLQFHYGSAREARDILCKIVGHEAAYNNQVFKLANSRGGMLINWKLIEVLEPTIVPGEEPGSGSLYLVIIRVTKTDVWGPDQIHRFHHVTCTFRGTPPRGNRVVNMERRGKIVSMRPNAMNDHVIVGIRVRGINNFKFQKCYVRMAPSCPDYEHSTLNFIMNHWVNEPMSPRFEFLNGLLLGRADLGLPDDQVPQYTCSWLNEDQKRAFGLCQSMKIVGIQGPPGTGKTNTAVSFLLKAAANEKGLMIAVAKSNVAADKIASDIIKLKTRYPAEFGHLRMIRMASTKREQLFISKLPQVDVMFRDENERYLHDEVIQDPDFWNDFQDDALFQKINRGGMDDITNKEMKKVQAHISKHSYRVLKKVSIVVTTLSCLSDNRLAKLLNVNLNEPGREKKNQDEDEEPFDKDLKVNSIIIDEAGVIPFPMIIPVLIFKPNRILLFGDNDQLPPQVNCPSAESACLNMSALSYIKYGLLARDGRVWHMLTTQYRMHPDICKIVSHMTYHDRLVCAPQVAEREQEQSIKLLIQRVTNTVREAKKSRVLVFDHKGKEETMASNSKKNSQEAILVKDLVAQLMTSGITAESIVVLTFYDAQRKLIQELLTRHQQLKLTVRVCNIDAFQGQEADIVVLSMVRGNDQGNIGFCKSPNRLNVMISRARYFQFIIGNMSTFFHKPENHIERLQKSLRSVKLIKIKN